MQCPVCTDVTLTSSSREGVAIEHCPRCRGVWLGRDQLDEIIDRVVGDEPSPDRSSPDQFGAELRRDPRYDQRMETPRRDRYEDWDRQREEDRRTRRRSFLEELFDLD